MNSASVSVAFDSVDLRPERKKTSDEKAFDNVVLPSNEISRRFVFSLSDKLFFYSGGRSAHGLLIEGNIKQRREGGQTP